MSPARSAAERRRIATIAALTKHSQCDSRSATEAARKASHVTRFEKLVDPDGTLPRAELERRVAAARKAYFLRLAHKSAVARRARQSTVSRKRLPKGGGDGTRES